MAIEELSNVDPDMIMKLMREDQTFMYRLDLVKDKIRTNLDDYADSIGEASFGMFDEEELDEIEVAKDSIMGAWRSLEERLNVNVADTLDFDPENIDVDGNIAQEEDSASGVFEKETPSFILESFGDGAITQIKEALGMEEKIANTGDNFASGDVGKGVMGSLMGAVLANSGIKVPSFVSSIASSAGALAPVVMIAGGILWGAMDGIKAILKADEWGTSKVSAFLGGFFSGETMFGNMGKWALMGAGIGLVGGPIGMVAGGVIGAVAGAVLNWIGPEKVAQTFDKIGAWFSEKWGELTVGFKDGFVEGIGYFLGNINAKFWSALEEAWLNIKYFFTKEGFGKAKDKVIELHDRLTGFLGDWMSSAWEKIKGWWKRGKKAFDEGQNAEILADIEREQSKLAIESRTIGAPAIQAPEVNADVEAYKAELEKANVLAMENAKRQEMKDKEGNAIQEEQLAILTQIAEKPVGGGGGSANIKLDQGEIREATTDAAYNMRQQYYMRGL
jgi:hypothetical protein